MLTLVVGTDTKCIDKAVEVLVNLEKDREVIHFKDLAIKLKDTGELPDIYNSVILLDYPDILARNSSTKLQVLITYMVIQSRMRNNHFIARALDWKKLKTAPNVDKRIDRAHDVLVTAGEDKLILWDRRINKRVVLTYN